MMIVGLSMMININQHEYIKQAGDTAGAIVVLRPQNQMPFPEDDGIIVSPGLATSIAITQVNKKLRCRRETARRYFSVCYKCVYVISLKANQDLGTSPRILYLHFVVFFFYFFLTKNELEGTVKVTKNWD